MIDTLLAWASGQLSQGARIWTALGPGLVLAAYFLGGLVPFALRCRRHGLPRDPEVEQRGKTLLVGFFLRHYFFWAIEPFYRLVVWSGVPASALTTLAALLGLASGFAVAIGRFALGGWLFLLAGILDTLDGRVARRRGTASSTGAAIDSVLDRYTDSALVVGLAWYYRESWVLAAALLALVGGSMVPYVRARGEGLGIAVRGGLMQRLERVLILGVSVALSPVHAALAEPEMAHPMHWPAVAGLVLVGITSNFTAVGRLLTLIRATRGAPPSAPRTRSLASLLGFNAAAAALATWADFALVLLVVESLGLSPSAATAAGAAFGAVVNFYLNRHLTFRSTSAQLPQAGRYALVSLMSVLLNAGGVALVTALPAVDYRWGWWVVRGAVWLFWNFPLHKGYVFAARVEPRSIGSAVDSR